MRTGYGEAREIMFGKRRCYLVAVPGAPGYWMLCPTAIQVGCPECGAQSMEPCMAARGHLVLTASQTESVQEVVGGKKLSQAKVQRLREKVRCARFYRAEPHDGRTKLWRERGFNNPPREEPAQARKLKARLKEEIRRRREVEVELSEARTILAKARAAVAVKGSQR